MAGTVHLLAFRRGPRQRTWCDSIIHVDSHQLVTDNIEQTTCETCLSNVASYERSANDAINEAAR